MTTDTISTPIKTDQDLENMKKKDEIVPPEQTYRKSFENKE